MQIDNQKKLGQFFTPVWAAEILFKEHFSHLTDKDFVWEPSCGQGSCLSAIPAHIPAVGSEIDPALAELAYKNTGRPIYTGDFRYVSFPELNRITAVFGNPPFTLDAFEGLMERCSMILSLGNKAGFIIPAYFFQTARTFMRFARKWEITQEIIPVDLFKGERVLSKPLIFASFIRDNSPQIVGFRLHSELCDMQSLDKEIRNILNNQVKRSGSVWREALVKVVQDSGGTATLNDVYTRMQKKRPTENPFWKEKIRQIIQESPFKKVDTATYQLMQ